MKNYAYKPVPSRDDSRDDSQDYTDWHRSMSPAVWESTRSEDIMRKVSTFDVEMNTGSAEWFVKASDVKAANSSIDCRQPFIWHTSLHCVAVFIYLGRAVTINNHDYDKMVSILPSLSFAGAFFVIGVLMPLWSHRVALSSEVMCILAHRHRYDDLKGQGFRHLMAIAAYLGPFFNLLALVGPVHAGLVLLTRYTYEKQATEIYRMDLDTMLLSIFVCSCTGMAGMLVFSSGKCGEMVVDASKVAVLGLIRDMDTEEFDTICKQFYYLSKAVYNVWDWHRVGGIFLIRVLVLFLASFAFGVYSLPRHATFARNALIGVSILLTLCGLGLLLQLAQITALFQDRKPGATSLAAKADQYIFCDEEEEDLLFRVSSPSSKKNKHRMSKEVKSILDLSLNLKRKQQLAKMSANTYGISTCGIVFTNQLVLGVARNMVLYFPLALSVAGHLLHQERQSKQNQLWMM